MHLAFLALSDRNRTGAHHESEGKLENLPFLPNLPSPFDWQVTPETARLLQHWRSHKFNSIRPFFCDSSQMPVMQGEREVKGVVTWKSIGSKLALGCKADHVGECREDARIVD